MKFEYVAFGSERWEPVALVRWRWPVHLLQALESWEQVEYNGYKWRRVA